MKSNVQEATVESSMSFRKSVDMGISERGMLHLMPVLSNLYNDPMTAVIREYFTNALDATVRAGKSIPVEVYLPTSDNPIYVVKDFGVGMSEHEFEFVFAMFGETTKDETNEESGHFGLGCKSAMAIATQFTVTSIKDGVKNTVLISKKADGRNKLDFLHPKEVDLPNGTTVTIPVANVYEFNQKAKEFFKYVDPSKVRVNGHTPENIMADAHEIKSTLSTVKIFAKERAPYSYNDPTFKVIMGEVPYALTAEQVREAMGRKGITFDLNASKLDVFFIVDIGSVDLTPNREGLRFTDTTQDFIDEVVEAYVVGVRSKALAEIDAVDARSDVHAVINKWSRLFDRKTMMWRGETVPESVKMVDKVFKTVWRSGDSAEHSTSSFLRLGQGKYTIVYGRDPEEYKKVSAYLSPYMSSVGVDHGHFYFTDEITSIDNKWITENSDFVFVEADKLVEIGKAKRKEDRAAAKAALGTPEKFRYPVMDLATGDIKNVPYDQIESGLPYLHTEDFTYSIGGLIGEYFTGRREIDSPYDINRRKKIATALAHFTPAKKVVLIGGNRKVSALVTRLDSSYNILVDFEKKIKGAFDVVDQRVKDIEAVRSTRYSTLFDLFKKHKMEGMIEDRQIRRLINPTKKARRTHAELVTYETHLGTVRPDNKSVSIPDTSEVVKDLTAKYPLLMATNFERTNLVGLEHLIKYINLINAESLTEVP